MKTEKPRHMDEAPPLPSGMGTAANASPKTEAGFLAAYPHVHPAHCDARRHPPFIGYGEILT